MEKIGSPNTSDSPLRRDHEHLNGAHSDSPTHMNMENLLGLLRVRIKRGVNLAVRDVRSSDPYVVVRMGAAQVLHTFFFFLLFLILYNIHHVHALGFNVDV